MYYWTVVAVVVVAVCSCERGSFSITPVPVSETEDAPPATTPEQLLDNLDRAMRDRDKALYETLLDEDFQFTEFDCLGNIVFYNDLETELNIIVGSRDDRENSSSTEKALFDIFSEFHYDFHFLLRWQELGSEHPETFPGDPDAHPDEDWEVFSGRVLMRMLDENGDGYSVDQPMTFKVRYDEKGLWRIVRWIDDPLTGSCGSGEILMKASTWGSIKSTIFSIGSS